MSAGPEPGGGQPAEGERHRRFEPTWAELPALRPVGGVVGASDDAAITLIGLRLHRTASCSTSIRHARRGDLSRQGFVDLGRYANDENPSLQRRYLATSWPAAGIGKPRLTIDGGEIPTSPIRRDPNRDRKVPDDCVARYTAETAGRRLG